MKEELTGDREEVVYTEYIKEITSNLKEKYDSKDYWFIATYCNNKAINSVIEIHDYLIETVDGIDSYTIRCFRDSGGCRIKDMVVVITIPKKNLSISELHSVMINYCKHIPFIFTSKSDVILALHGTKDNISLSCALRSVIYPDVSKPITNNVLSVEW